MEVTKNQAIVRILLFMFATMGLIAAMNELKEKPIFILFAFICALGVFGGFYNIYKICKTDEEIKEEKDDI